MNRVITIAIFIIGLSGITSCAPTSQHRRPEVETTALSGKSVDTHNSEISQFETDDLEEPKGPLTLSQAISLVLTRSPELKVYSWDIRSADARRVQAHLHPNPELAISTEEFGGSGARKGFDGAETIIAVAQPIEIGGKRDKRSQVAALEKKLAEWDHNTSRLGIIRQTQQAFVEVLGMQRRIELTKDQMDLAQELLVAVRKRVEAGKDSPSEADKAQIEFANTQMEYKQATGTLVDARHRLAMLWGAANPGFEQAAGSLDIDVKLPTLNRLKQQAQLHPQILRWQDEQALGRARLELAKAQAHSDIAITAGLKRLEQENDNTAIVGLAIPLPVFNRNQGSIKEAQYELAKTQQRRYQTLAQFESQLAQYRQRFETALAHVSMLKDVVLSNARTVFEVARTGYEGGKFDYLHLLDAQRTLFNTEIQLLNAQISVRLARADLEYAVGQSLESIPTESSNKGIEK
ncbi:MAG: TolC family protein [Phycisphaerales bacterium]|nr:MAG: TolC family protein [Phycisphaerales bacterium]